MPSLGAASLLSWLFLDRLRLQGYVSGVGRAGWGGHWGKSRGPCVSSAWSRNIGAPIRCDKSQMRFGFEKLEEGILRWVREIRRKERPDYLHMSQDMWSRNAQRNGCNLKGGKQYFLHPHSVLGTYYVSETCSKLVSSRIWKRTWAF